jgi:hypothetical protein
MPNWEAIGAIGEVLGTLAVLITILYLSRQIKLSTAQQRSESQRSVSEEFNRMMDVYYDRESSQAMNEAFNHWEEASLQERSVLAAFLYKYGNHVQTMFFMWKSGIMEEEVYFSEELAFLSIICTAGGKEWWNTVKGQYSDTLIRRLEQVAEEQTILPLTEQIPWLGSFRDV